MKLKPSENMLVGKWKLADGKLVADDVCERIDALVDRYLTKLGIDTSGWDSLYKDPIDNRLWELTYPQSDMQGGGPPCLAVIEEAVAKIKYDVMNYI